MIQVRDWIASIPDEEKHIAYVGEGKSEQREFLLCGEGWKTYRDWSFHLDMAFDSTTITTRDSRQVVQTTVNSTEYIEETSVTTDEVTTKETYTVNDVQVTNHNLTDIAPLSKSVTNEGIRLTWTVLRQHTVLPGKLWATIRAVDGEAQCIKKSAIMVFEVDPAICAVPATVPPVSEFEQMTAQMDALRQKTETAADMAIRASNTAAGAANDILDHLDTVQKAANRATTAADEAIRASTSATIAADGALHNLELSITAADTAQAAAQTTVEHSATVAANTEQVSQNAKDTAAYAASASISLQGAKKHCASALDAAEQSAASATQAQAAAQTMQNATYRRINVRDYGAVGDGIADDRRAIIDAFTAAKSMLPCEIYFPAGTYGISNGITVEMACGSGGLRVRGAGRDITAIQYLESYDPNQPDNLWHAICILPDTTPSVEEEYLHDISITGLCVRDPSPIAHAQNTAKGDPADGATHGLSVQFCRHVTVTDCKVDSVGNSGIAIAHCQDVTVNNNRLVNCPAAGTNSSAILIDHGCQGVMVSGNVLNGSAQDETLADGTVLAKINAGITAISRTQALTDVTISDNVITHVQGSAVHLGSTLTLAALSNALVANNIIDHCCMGVDDEGIYPKQGIKICDNLITNLYQKGDEYGCAIRFNTGLVDLTVTGNTIKNIEGERAIYVLANDATQLYADNLVDGLEHDIFYGSGNVTIRDCVMQNTGLSSRGSSGAILFTAGELKVANCTMKNVCNTKGIVGATIVENTDIELVHNGNVISGEYLQEYNNIARLRRVIGCHLRGRMVIRCNCAVIQGVTIESDNIGNTAIIVSASGVQVIGCTILTKSNNAIQEIGNCDYNVFANNIIKRPLVVTGAHSVSVNNVTLNDTISTT